VNLEEFKKVIKKGNLKKGTWISKKQNSPSVLHDSVNFGYDGGGGKRSQNKLVKHQFNLGKIFGTDIEHVQQLKGLRFCKSPLQESNHFCMRILKNIRGKKSEGSR